MSTERRKLVAGNWKMQLSHKGAVENARALKQLVKEVDLVKTDLVVFPSYPSLAAVAEELEGGPKIAVGAQNAHWEEKGAVTGAVSVSQIAPFAEWCLVGHSEQRKLVGMSEKNVAATCAMLVTHGITPVVCLGETKEEKEKDETVAKLTEQVSVLLSVLSRVMIPKIVVAYEPIWAISSEQPEVLPDPLSVAELAVLIRKTVAAKFDGEVADRLRIIYGGSVDRKNVGDYASEPGVDGVLPGSASLQPRQLVEMAQIVDKSQTGR